MTRIFEELDYSLTRLGELSLRRRRSPLLDIDIYEVKLDDEFLMSSLFTEAEIALANLALAEVDAGELDVVVGGLGLGYTARAVLDDPGVRSLLVIDTLTEVIEWHRRGFVPLGKGISSDPRCRLVEGDFFTLAASAEGFDPAQAGRCFNAILLDIDHSPRDLLAGQHAAFYQADGLLNLARHLYPGGVFALWSNDPPDAVFRQTLGRIFETVAAQVVKFDNPLQDCESANTVYVARKAVSKAKKETAPAQEKF
jgi:spermidine synthase